jgi:hypothetical protein
LPEDESDTYDPVAEADRTDREVDVQTVLAFLAWLPSFSIPHVAFSYTEYAASSLIVEFTNLLATITWSPRFHWGMSGFHIERCGIHKNHTYPEALWYAIRMPGTVAWMQKSGSIPPTSLWES